jgi:hypothetical protein
VFTASQHKTPDGNHIHVADGFTDDGERVVANFAIWHEIIRTDQVARINIGFRNELVDIDGAVRVESDVFEFVFGDFDIAIERIGPNGRRNLLLRLSFASVAMRSRSQWEMRRLLPT